MGFSAMVDFDARVLRPLQTNRFFRLVTDVEVDASYDAYQSREVSSLLSAWRQSADPTRVRLPALNARAFAEAHRAPQIVNGLMFLATVRAGLSAGRTFRQRLRPELQRAFSQEFPWLENRHQHVPSGWAPACEFPSAIDAFFDGATLDEAKARWQVVAALNEVMQACYTQHLAKLLGLPMLSEHAAREEALAHNYFAHWSPEVTRELWRQCIIVIDGISAAVFEMACDKQLKQILAYSLMAGFAKHREWRSFVDGLKTPQWLMPIKAAG